MSAARANLLVELLVEELPPKALRQLGQAFAEGIVNGLEKAQLVDRGDAGSLRPFASPRRLGVWIADVRAQAPQRSLSHKLVPAAVGLDTNGQPTAPLLKKLAALGVAGADTGISLEQIVATLRRQIESKSEILYIDVEQPGLTLTQGLQAALDAALGKLPIPKLMSYQLADGWSNVSFVRPAHGLIALHGETVVPVHALGLQAGRETQGHRFEAAHHPLVVQHADDYARLLRADGAVIADFAERRAVLVRQLEAAAQAHGLRAIDDEALLDEVCALVERPNVLTCAFEPEFLAVPQECLILTMKANQKYFPLLDAAGKLTEKFLVVSNISPADPSRVIEGNERVIRPRLADAKFFFDQDRKKTLESRVAGLAKVVYHGKLGSQGDRAERVGAIAQGIVDQLSMATLPFTVDAQDEFAVLASKVQQAARLAKADLLTDMVGEFPELQGIMGGYYARHEGLRDGVAIAIEDHYKPRFAGDALPRNHTGTVVALADKLETLVGLFGIGQLPTGDKDPFALRRHALGVIRILIDKNLPLEWPGLVQAALPAFGDLITDPSAALWAFFADRLAVSLRDQGFSAQEVDAVLALAPGRLGDVPKRLEAVRVFATLPEAAALAAANKRVGNILRKSDAAPGAGAKVDTALLVEPAEQVLFAQLQAVAPVADAAFAHGDYAASLQALAALRSPVDAFFETVMVNAEDLALRANRLALLAALHSAMNRVADLSRLAN